MNSNRWLLLLVIVAIIPLCGCLGKTYTLNPPAAFDYRTRPESFKVNTGIYLNEDTRNFEMTVDMYFSKIALGKTLEAHIMTSLGKILSSIILIPDKNAVPQDIERIMSIEIGKDTDYESRTKRGSGYPIKEYTAKVILVYKVTDRNGSLLMEGKATGSVQREEVFLQQGGGLGIFGGAVGGYIAGTSSRNISYALKSSLNDSLALALEDLNEQIVASAKKDNPKW
jgi:hypothetical protein